MIIADGHEFRRMNRLLMDATEWECVACGSRVMTNDRSLESFEVQLKRVSKSNCGEERRARFSQISPGIGRRESDV